MSASGIYRGIPCGLHENLDDVTPVERLFTLWHLGMPNVDERTFCVSVDGLVERENTFTMTDVLALPAHTVAAFHECAGSPFAPHTPVRRVGNVRWTGCRLRDVLASAGLREGARFVWTAGRDNGNCAGEFVPAYTKDLPLEKALAPEVLLAYACNGAPLTPEHGAPLRLVVPGYYGTNMVKWLSNIRVAAERAPGLFTTRLYNDELEVDGKVRSAPVWGAAPHSTILQPAPGNRRTPAEALEVWGRAWGEAPIVRVEVSVDGGISWHVARVEPRSAWEWQRFSWTWPSPAPGTYALVSRAFSARDEMQSQRDARTAWYTFELTLG